MTPNRSPEQNIFRAGFIGAGFLGQALRDDRNRGFADTLIREGSTS